MEPGLFFRVRVRKPTLTVILYADESWKCHVLDLNCRFSGDVLLVCFISLNANAIHCREKKGAGVGLTHDIVIGQELFQFFRVGACADVSVTVLPLYMQLVLRSLCTLKIQVTTTTIIIIITDIYQLLFLSRAHSTLQIFIQHLQYTNNNCI